MQNKNKIETENEKDTNEDAFTDMEIMEQESETQMKISQKTFIARDINENLPEYQKAINEVFRKTEFIKTQIPRSKIVAYLNDLTHSQYSSTCASGTDALRLCLLSISIKPGDEIITTPFSFPAAAEMIIERGAVPVFIDIGTDFNMDPDRISSAITARTRAILPVSLFGIPADFDRINEIAYKNELFVIEDAAQSLGARYKFDEFSGGCTDFAITSFHPAKPFGCFGDGGAFFAKDSNLFYSMKRASNHGRACGKHKIIGMNSRLDNLQEKLLLPKLRNAKHILESRRAIANIYTNILQDFVKTPKIKNADGMSSSCSQYTIQSQYRDKIHKNLRKNSIQSQIFYPEPIYRMEAFATQNIVIHECPTTELMCQKCISLPIHHTMRGDEAEFVANIIRKTVERSK